MTITLITGANKGLGRMALTGTFTDENGTMPW